MMLLSVGFFKPLLANTTALISVMQPKMASELMKWRDCRAAIIQTLGGNVMAEEAAWVWGKMQIQPRLLAKFPPIQK